MKHAILTASISFVLGAGLVTLAMVLGKGAPTKNRAVTSSPTPADSGPRPRDRKETTTYRAITPTVSPAARVEVELIGYRDRWQVRYRDRAADGEPDGAVVEVPAETDVRLTLKSRDYVYMLSMPHINESQVAVPGLEFHLGFRTLSPGVFFLHGDHLCGPTDPRLTVTVRVGPHGGDGP
jgi:heme/copper-type cytochrome/quinol oxidase subunit 2